MKLVLQIAGGILLAGMVSFVFWLSMVSAVLHSVASPVTAQQIAVPVQQAVGVAAKQIQWSFQNQQAMQKWKAEQHQQALQLQPGQLCLGGFGGRPGTVVIRSGQNGVQVATQLVENGRPVQCVGDHRVN